MRRRTLAMAAMAMVAMALDGCGEDPGIEQGTVPWKGSDTAPLDPLKSQMTKNMQDKSYIHKGEEGEKPAGESKPAAESKPAGESRPAGESKAAAESKPAGDSKPATKGG
jgi:hypothetical protein